MIFAIFKLSGYISMVKCKLYILQKRSAIDSFVNFNMFTKMLFIIAALLLSMLDVMSSISFLILGDIKMSMLSLIKISKVCFLLGWIVGATKQKNLLKLLAKYFGLASALSLIVNDGFWRFRLFSFQWSHWFDSLPWVLFPWVQ